MVRSCHPKAHSSSGGAVAGLAVAVGEEGGSGRVAAAGVRRCHRKLWPDGKQDASWSSARLSGRKRRGVARQAIARCPRSARKGESSDKAERRIRQIRISPTPNERNPGESRCAAACGGRSAQHSRLAAAPLVRLPASASSLRHFSLLSALRLALPRLPAPPSTLPTSSHLCGVIDRSIARRRRLLARFVSPSAAPCCRTPPCTRPPAPSTTAQTRPHRRRPRAAHARAPWASRRTTPSSSTSRTPTRSRGRRPTRSRARTPTTRRARARAASRARSAAGPRARRSRHRARALQEPASSRRSRPPRAQVRSWARPCTTVEPGAATKGLAFCTAGPASRAGQTAPRPARTPLTATSAIAARAAAIAAATPRDTLPQSREKRRTVQSVRRSHRM